MLPQYEVSPHLGVGPIRFGMTREQVRAQMPGDPKVFRKTPDGPEVDAWNGHGRQGMSWIHERDMNRIFERALTDDSMSGAYIATAPEPVSNAEFMRQLRRAVRCPIGLPTPAFGVRIVAPLLMGSDPELALYGRYCVSRRLREEEFEFAFPTLPAALADLLRGARPHAS